MNVMWSFLQCMIVLDVLKATWYQCVYNSHGSSMLIERLRLMKLDDCYPSKHILLFYFWI